MNQPRTHQRVCAWCHSGIAEQRPVFLVALEEGQIMGPFHAGCAERLKLEAHKLPRNNDGRRFDRYGTWPTVREETLPE